MAADLRKVLEAELGSSCAVKFQDEHLADLVAAGFLDAQDLRNAANQGLLQQLKLPPARLGNLLDHFKAAAHPQAAPGSLPVGQATLTRNLASQTDEIRRVVAVAVAVEEALNKARKEIQDLKEANQDLKEAMNNLSESVGCQHLKAH